MSLFFASLWVPHLGEPAWQHVATLLMVLAPLPFFWRPLTTSRMVLGIGVLASTLLAVGSGFFILYAKVWLKAHVLVDWIKFWHVLWSWAGIVFFLLHTWINRVAYVHFWRRMHALRWPALLHHAAIVASLAAIPFLWSAWGKPLWDDENYILSTWYLWLLLVAPAYVLWWATVAARRWVALSVLAGAFQHHRVRAFVDVALVPATVLANVSGFPITFWKDEVHGHGFKFVGKMTHTAPSIVMAVLVFAHTVHLWGPIVLHVRRFVTGEHRPGL